jgi:hypothetical protein
MIVLKDENLRILLLNINLTSLNLNFLFLFYFYFLYYSSIIYQICVSHSSKKICVSQRVYVWNFINMCHVRKIGKKICGGK